MLGARGVRNTPAYSRSLKGSSLLQARRTSAPARPARSHSKGAAPLNSTTATPYRRCNVVPHASQQQSVTINATQSPAERVVRVHYIKKDHDTKGWGLHTWGAAAQHTVWQQPLSASGYESDGTAFWDLPIHASSATVMVGLLIHKGEMKAAHAEVQVPADAQEVWLVGDEQVGWTHKPDLKDIPAGSINKQGAIWMDATTIAWRHPLHDGPGGPQRSFKLHVSRSAALSIDGHGVQGADLTFDLTPGLPNLLGRESKHLMAKFPFLAGCSTLNVPPEVVERHTDDLLQGQVLISMASSDGMALDATGVQMHGLIDAKRTYDGPLGFHRSPAVPSGAAVSVWAPTAQSVQLLHWEGPRGGSPEVLPMQRSVEGVWSLPVPEEWAGSYYKYRVQVYCPWTRRIETTEASDPYAVSLAADGDRTQLVFIDDPALQPQGWQEDVSPRVDQWTDISIYELHIRDFSISDTTVPEKLRGKYLAFSPQAVAEAAGKPLPSGGSGATAGLQHLGALQRAGLNHLHLLPVYDYGSVPERDEDQAKIEDDLSSHASDSDRQQAAVAAVCDQDAFNWGYDPVHWSVPEGSYATDPDGVQRILEARQMIMALHQQGWRVVLDVVYNHVFAAGPHNKYSVLDKIVPGYYHRRFEDGEICQSTCCNNTAAENYMCERMMVDDIVLWAQHYKIDSFRFDIMGHLMVSTLEKMRARLDALTLEEHGVDGKAIYIYGEAWDFGEVVDNQRGINCGQMNLAGTGLGSFNDRLRDGALGGGPFEPYHYQGVVTGLALAPNGISPSSGNDYDELMRLSDMIRYSLAGNLRSYSMQNWDGVVRDGQTATQHGQPLAYGTLPHEHVAFVGCHDNLTIFDYIVEKSPATTTAEERMRMCVMCLSMIALSQGVVFFHAGDDLLRSKSLDRDSYNSGDHFNRIDWTGHDNNFGVGLPSANKNIQGWDYKRQLLANPTIKPSPNQIGVATQLFQLMLQIRYSSPLFRLSCTDDILQQLTFPNVGPNQIPGVIVMQLTSADQLPTQASPPSGTLDPSYKRLFVVFNCTPVDQELAPPAGTKGSLVLHPLQADFRADERTSSGCRVLEGGELKVAARSTAVFVEPR